jgi:mono/diheme cytochrome c family protein
MKTSFGSAVPGLRGSEVLAAFCILLAAIGIVARADSGRSSAAAAAPTFASDVAPIIFANCASCHRPGQAAPFSLLSYDDVKKHAKTIVDVTKRRYMPPWHASRAEGFPEFLDERRLTDADISTIARWVEAGTPPGDLRKAPLPPSFVSGWALGIPDVILRLPRAITVPADGPDLFRNVALTVDLPDDKWITAIDFQPSARSVVHHALFFSGPATADVSDTDILPGINLTARLSQAMRGAGANAASPGAQASESAFGGIGGWVPGLTPRFYPDGIAQALPKHSNVVVQLHLHPTGKEEREEGQLAIYFAKKSPTRSLVGIQVPPMFGFAMGIDIPAGEKQYTIHDTFELPVAATVYGARGHAHYLARQMKMTATLPNGSTRGLLWIKDWDFGWQDSYFFKTPIALPAGTKLDTAIIYDNSSDNSRNPNSPIKEVRWGRESFDEMGSMTALIGAPPGSGDVDALKQASAAHFRQQFIAQFIKK